MKLFFFSLLKRKWRLRVFIGGFIFIRKWKLFVFKIIDFNGFFVFGFTEARAEIVGPSLRYLTPGSTLKLMCRIVQNTEASAFIFWYHDNRMINYDVDRGINVSTEAGKFTLEHIHLSFNFIFIKLFNILDIYCQHYNALCVTQKLKRKKK